MLLRFPPDKIDPADPSFLQGGLDIYAKLKIESKAGTRRVFLTEHTLLMVVKGEKLLHFADHTCRVNSNQVVLLKKGIYVMAEYFDPGVEFEAILLFLPVKLLRAMMSSTGAGRQNDSQCLPYLKFDATLFTQRVKADLRHYFDQRILQVDELLPLKQKEILILLMSAGHKKEIGQFIQAAVGSQAGELDYVMTEYLFQPLTLGELAGLCNRSLASFKRDFQRLYECPPRKWINQQRLAQAQSLLQNTDLPVAAVAGECGYENASYFIRIFKEAYGCTPAAFRAKITIE